MFRILFTLPMLLLTFLASAQTTPVYKTYQGYSIDFRTISGVKVVGLSNPIPTRAVLEAIEKDLIIESFPDFDVSLFLPQTRAKAQQIQQYRQSHWTVLNGKKVREQEMIATKNAMTNLQSLSGMDPVQQLIQHYNALTEVWNNSRPAIDLIPRFKRLIVISDNIVSKDDSRSDNTEGWQVRNDESFSFWANDEFRGTTITRGDIPYDIDSRWVINANWPIAMYNGGLSYVNTYSPCNCKVDYGLLHEITHHIPVGDNYYYAPGSGTVDLPNAAFNKKVNYSFVSDYYSFQNDIMSNAKANKITAVSAYHMLLWRKINPSLYRNPQKGEIYDQNFIYGNFYYDTLTIKLSNLSGFNLSNVYLLKENGPDLIKVTSSEFLSQKFQNGTYTITLNRDQQNALYPAFHIGLEKDGVILPISIPRNVIEMLNWKDRYNLATPPSSFVFNINVKNYAANALAKMKEVFAAGDRGNTYLRTFVYNTGQETYNDIFADSKIDDLGNYFAVEFAGANKSTLVNLLSPVAGSSYSISGGAVPFKGWVSTSATNVYFNLDGQQLTATNAGNNIYTYNWTPTAGSHQVKLVAVANGVTYESPLNTFTVSTPVSVSVLRTVSQWSTGYQLGITITNNGSTPINGWNLQIVQNDPVGSLWDASLTTSGTTLTFKNLSYNSVINPGQQVNFGYNGTLNGALDLPATGILNGQTITFSAAARLGVNESQESLPKIYPNPTVNTLTIPSIYDAKQVIITNGINTKVYQLNGGESVLDVSELGAGIYSVEITGAEKSVRDKLVIQK